jgi:hypothetical protein
VLEGDFVEPPGDDGTLESVCSAQPKKRAKLRFQLGGTPKQRFDD